VRPLHASPPDGDAGSKRCAHQDDVFTAVASRASFPIGSFAILHQAALRWRTTRAAIAVIGNSKKAIAASGKHPKSWNAINKPAAIAVEIQDQRPPVLWRKMPSDECLAVSGGKAQFFATNHPDIQLGKFGRSRSNVWHCPGANTFRKGRLEDLAAHPTIKPVRLYAEILKDCSRPQNIALDCFAGSGTMLLAAEQLGRRARVMELDPKYADVAIRRW